MSPDAESYVLGPRGPVHTGPGDQYNVWVNYYDRVRDLFVRELRAVPHEHVSWLYPRFVEPRNYGQAQGLLEDNGSVLLTGAPGSGRRAAAQMLLHDPSGAGGLIRELPDTSDSGKPVLDGSQVEANERLLLDLTTSEEKANGTLLGKLGAYRAVVRERGARLVIVLPPSQTHHLGAELGPPPVVIGRPNGTNVFQRYLGSDRIPFSRDQLDAQDLADLLRRGPMRHIAKLSGLVQLASELEPAQAFPDWLGEALAALTERSAKVTKRVKKLRLSEQRALLLTTAMLSGAPADAVFGATSELLEAVKHPKDDELPLLERRGFTEQLTEIGAITDGAGRVGFTRLAYDRAVRTHFWANYPDLRDAFRDWVKTAIKQPALTNEDRDTAVTSFAEQALRTGRPDDLRRLAEHWAERTDPRRPSKVWLQAVRALEHGLGDERHSFFFRRQLYTWSRQLSLSPDLAQVVVRVCSDVLAPTHPKPAVVRLHHIFRGHYSGAAGATAYHALLDLVDRDRRLYSYLLDRATCEPRPEEGAVADLDLFLELAYPARLTAAQQQMPPLIEDVTVQAQLVSGWKAALAALAAPSCVHHVQSWLVACADDRFCEPLLDVLVKAGDGRDDVLSRLYVIARDWAHAPDERRAERIGIAARLNNKIDTAQGIDLTDLDPLHRTEETSP